MKYFFILILLFPLVSFGQNTIPCGQGILKIEFIKSPTISFYNDTLQTKVSKSVSIIKSGEEFTFKNQKEVTTWFKPEQLFLEYNIFILRVDTIIGKWASVYVNNDTKLWTKVESYKIYFNWNKFFKTQVTNISKGPNKIDIKQLDNESAKTIKKMEQEDCFEILEVKGDWLKIRTHTILECSISKRPIKSGWLKWKENNKLTIKFGLTD